MNQNVKTGLIIRGVSIPVLIVLPLVFRLISGWQGYRYGMMGPWMIGGFDWNGANAGFLDTSLGGYHVGSNLSGSRSELAKKFRLTLGRWGTCEEIDIAGDLIMEQAKRLVTAKNVGLTHRGR